jgi:hypothetical protein
MCVVIGLALAGAACAEGTASVPPDKQALVQHVVDKLALESVGLQMLQAPVADMLQQSRVLIQTRVPADKQEAALKDVTAEASKFMEEEAPLLRASTQAIVHAEVAPMLAQKFSADELKQLAALLDSPVLAKFETLVPELRKTVGENLAKANQAQIKPKMAELQNRVGLRLRAAVAQ